MIDPSVRNLYSPAKLTEWVTRVFMACDVDEAGAKTSAEILVRTNVRGIDTHGVIRLLPYVEKLRTGEVNARPVMRHEIRNGVLLFDGDRGLGQAVAKSAVETAIGLARDAAVVPCIIRNSGHLAALGIFTLAAAESGMIAILCQETPPLMALAGSTRPTIGNNPIAFAAPLRDRPPLVFDMATSVVARGNLLQAQRANTRLPEGWAIGPTGEPTDDPTVALAGSMLPIAGHKGIGLAMMVQVLAGSLSGSATAATAAAFGSTSSAGNVSAFLLLINPERFTTRSEFDGHIEGWLGAYMRGSGNQGRYPGQRAAQCEAERLRLGVPLSAVVIGELRKAGALAGEPFALEPLTAA